MTKILKRLWILVVALFCCCEKQPVENLSEFVNGDYLSGRWNESYDSEQIAVDGSVVYSFEGDSFSCYSAPWIAPEPPLTISGSFSISQDGLLRMVSSDHALEEYLVQRISDNVMVWIKPGTENLQGRYLDNRRRFVRIRE